MTRIGVFHQGTAVGVHPDRCGLRHFIPRYYLGRRRNRRTGKRLAGLDTVLRNFIKTVRTLQIGLHRILNLHGRPFCISKRIHIRHHVGNGVRLCQFLIQIPARKGVALLLGIGGFRDRTAIPLADGGYISTAVADKSYDISVAQHIPVKLNLLLERFCIKGTRLVLPGDDHLAVQGFFRARIYRDDICLRIIAEGIVCHLDDKIFITVIFVDLGEVFAVV